jgi:hypothetical protein
MGPAGETPLLELAQELAHAEITCAYYLLSVNVPLWKSYL